MMQLTNVVPQKVIQTISFEACLVGRGGERCKGEWVRQGPACKASRPRDAEYSSPGQRFTPIMCANLFQTW